MKTLFRKKKSNIPRIPVIPLDELRQEFHISCKRSPNLEIRLSDLTHYTRKHLKKDYNTELAVHLEVLITQLTKENQYNSLTLPSCSHLAVYYVTDELNMLEVFKLLENRGFQFEMENLYGPVTLYCKTCNTYHSSIEEKLSRYKGQVHSFINEFLY